MTGPVRVGVSLGAVKHPFRLLDPVRDEARRLLGRGLGPLAEHEILLSSPHRH